MKIPACFSKRLSPVLILTFHTSLALSDLPPSSDLILSDVEIVQVVLGPKGVIAGKPAALKLTIQSSFPIRKYVAVRVDYNSGDTYLDTGESGSGIPIEPGMNVVYFPGGPSFPAFPQPWEKEGEGPYLIWDTEASGDFVRVQIDAEETVTETDEENNRLSFYVNVFHMPRLKVLIAPVALQGQEDWDLDTDLIEKQTRFMQETYPVSDFSFTYRGLWRSEAPPDSFGGNFVDEDWFYTNVVLPLSAEADRLNFDRVVIVHTEDVWELTFCGLAIGMLREPQNRLPVVIASQDLEESNHCLNKEELIAHEIGHTYFLWHPFSSLFPLPVYDSPKYSVTDRIYDAPTNTFMDYAPAPHWIDEERYQSFPKTWVDCTSSVYPIEGTYMWNLWDQFAERPPWMSVVAVRGTIFKDKNKARLVSGYRFQGRPHIDPKEPPPSPPYYQIVLRGNQGKILAAYPFKASFEYALEPDFLEEVKIIQTDSISFNVNVPYVEGTESIQLKNPNGTVLGSIAVSPNSPQVNVLYPNGGEILPIGSGVESCWQGQDKDGDDLTYLLAYSKNGGSDWIPITSDLKETCHTWNTKGFPPGDQYMVKVIATDGVNTGEDRSNKTFSLFKPAPVPDIRINGSEGPLKLTRSQTATISLSLANNGWTDRVDWWFVMGAPVGLFSLTPSGWKAGLMPFYQGRLYNLPTFSFPPIPLAGVPTGQYVLVFGIDMSADGEVTWDSVYSDFVTVNVNP